MQNEVSRIHYEKQIRIKKLFSLELKTE